MLTLLPDPGKNQKTHTHTYIYMREREVIQYIICRNFASICRGTSPNSGNVVNPHVLLGNLVQLLSTSWFTQASSLPLVYSSSAPQAAQEKQMGFPLPRALGKQEVLGGTSSWHSHGSTQHQDILHQAAGLSPQHRTDIFFTAMNGDGLQYIKKYPLVI